MQREPMQAALGVIGVLDELGIPYLIGGSYASGVHGTYRATADIDLVADMRLEHAPPLARALADTYYVDVDMIREAIAQHRCFNVIHLATFFKVDVFVRRDRPFDRMQFARRQAHSLPDEPETPVWVASAEDTVLAKLEWYHIGGRVSDRQWRDITAVLKVQGERLDRAYLRCWAAELGVADLLEQAIREA